MCIAAGLVTSLSPEGNLKKYLKLLISLCLLASVLSPLISIFGDYKAIEENLGGVIEEITGEKDESNEDAIVKTRKKAVEQAVEELICGEFSLKEGNVSVEAELDAGNINAIEVRKLYIHIQEGDASKIEQYVSGLFKNTCKVIITGGGNGYGE